MSTAPTATVLPRVPAGAVWIPAASIVHDNYRTQYDEVHIANLAADIAARGLELLPVVERIGAGYAVISGNTRVIVMRDHLHMPDVPVEVRAYSSAAARLDDQVRENELRREVRRADRARVAVRMRDEFGYTAMDCASRLSCSPAMVRTYWQLADRLNDRSLDAWSCGDLSPAQAGELCRVARDRQDRIVDLARSDRFSVKAFADLIALVVAGQAADEQAGMFDMSEFEMKLDTWAYDAQQSAAISRPKTRAELEAEVERLRRLVPTVETVSMEETSDEPVGIVEISQRLGVARATVDMWRLRGLLPEPRWTVGGRPAWRWGDIAAWAFETGRLAPTARKGGDDAHP